MAGRIHSHLRNQWMGALALFLVMAGGGAYAAFDPVGSDGDVDACFQKRSGDLDLQKGKKCNMGEKPVTWSQVGPQGEPGQQGPQGEAGSQGAKGDPGATGAPGVSGYERIQVAETINAGETFKRVALFCPAGKKILGGGASVQTDKLNITSSFPTGSGDWFVQADVIPGQTLTSSSQVFAYVTCANVT